MPRKPSHVPAYRLHKPSGQARVIINGQHVYLGRYGSPESREKYARILAESATRQRATIEPPSGCGLFPGLSVSELILAYWRFAQTYYCKEGKPTKELSCMKEALHPLRHLYGATSARDFGPKGLKAVRQHMISQGISRGVVNHRVGRIKRVFKWAVAEELIPPSVHSALQAVTGLRYGRTEARETEPVKPVPDNWVKALRPYVAPQVAAMMQLQRLTGMRSCEVVIMRLCDIHRDGDVWSYEPYDHKNRWRGHRKSVPLGPKAQDILKPFLEREPTSYLFSPREADTWHKQHRRIHFKANRKTPIYPSELRARHKAKLARRNRNPKLDYLPRHRDQIEAELRGMIENWKDAGRPLDTSVKHPCGNWAQTIGGILLVNAFTGFLGNYSQRRSADDPVRRALGLLGASRPGEWLTSTEWAGQCADIGTCGSRGPRGGSWASRKKKYAAGGPGISPGRCGSATSSTARR